MNLKIIGSGDAFSTGGKLNTCFSLESKNKRFLVDCGATSLHGLKSGGIDPNNISEIFITHFHGDHYGGLPFFILDAQLIQSRNQKLTLIGPLGVEQRVKALMEAMFAGSSEMKLDFELMFVELQDFTPTIVNGVQAEYFPVIHAPNSNPHGVKITVDHKVFVYTGDTEWFEELVPITSGSNLTILECFSKKNSRYHMNYDELCRNLDRIESEKVMITHLGPDMINRKDLLVEVCYDGQEVVL